MKGFKYLKILAKIQVAPHFLCELEIFEETIYSNFWTFVLKRHVGAHLDGHQHGGGKQTEKRFATKAWIPLEELINMKLTLF